MADADDLMMDDQFMVAANLSTDESLADLCCGVLDTTWLLQPLCGSSYARHFWYLQTWNQG
jgi:hypothetical protein